MAAKTAAEMAIAAKMVGSLWLLYKEQYRLLGMRHERHAPGLDDGAIF